VTDLIDRLNTRIERGKAGDRAVAKLSGMTVAEFGADTTAPDPRLPDHERHTNRADRQVCCKTCHECGSDLRNVLDGELWCDTCGAYR
jgi:hypothetical protein